MEYIYMCSELTRSTINCFFRHIKIYLVAQLSYTALESFTVFIAHLCPGCERAVTTENCGEKRPFDRTFKNLKQLQLLSFTPHFNLCICLPSVLIV